MGRRAPQLTCRASINSARSVLPQRPDGGLTPWFSRKHTITIAEKPQPKSAWQQRATELPI